MKSIAIGICFVSALSCEKDDDDGGGSVIGNASRLTSSDLGLTQSSDVCTSSPCIPSSLSGRVFAAGAMLGQEDGYSMTFLADSEAVINDPSDTSHPEGTLEFDLGSPATFSGLISIPDEDSMPSDPTINRIETYFDFLDTSFTLSDTNGVDGTYTVRTVLRNTAEASDVAGTLSIGDLLIKAEGEDSFRWCKEDQGCAFSDRPNSPIQDEDALELLEDAQGTEGNPNYVIYSIDLEESLTVDHDTISDTTRLWTVDFDMSSAISFSTDVSSFESEEDIVEAFSLSLGCSSCTNYSNRLQATLTIGAAGSAN